MTKPDQRRLRILIILLIGLAATVFISTRMSRPSNPAVVQAENQKAALPVPVQPDARIRLDLLDKESSKRELGKKNLFQYGPPAPPPGSRQPVAQPSEMQPPTTQPTTNQRPVQAGPPAPPPPPPIPLKYIGFAFVEPNSKALIAALIDDSLRHFNFVEGDVYQGRYRIQHITDTSVEVEDLEISRKQMLPLVKQ